MCPFNKSSKLLIQKPRPKVYQSYKCEPVPRILGEYLHGYVSADAPVLHFGNNILQDVGIAVTTIADLHGKDMQGDLSVILVMGPAFSSIIETWLCVLLHLLNRIRTGTRSSGHKRGGYTKARAQERGGRACKIPNQSALLNHTKNNNMYCA